MRRKILIKGLIFLFLVFLLAFASCHKEEEKYAQKLIQTLDKGKVIKTRNAMDKISYCLSRYMMDHGGYPEGEEISSANDLLTPQYAPDLPRLDAWGNELRYSSNGNQYTLSSPGDDEIFHTEDDIVMVDGIYR